MLVLPAGRLRWRLVQRRMFQVFVLAEKLLHVQAGVAEDTGCCDACHGLLCNSNSVGLTCTRCLYDSG